MQPRHPSPSLNNTVNREGSRQIHNHHQFQTQTPPHDSNNYRQPTDLKRKFDEAIVPNTTTTTTTGNTTTSTDATSEMEKKKARLEAWKKKKEMGALQKLEEEKKQKVVTATPISNTNTPNTKPLSSVEMFQKKSGVSLKFNSTGTKSKHAQVPNNSLLNIMEDDDFTGSSSKSATSLSFLDDDEMITTNTTMEDEEDEFEKYMSTIHNNLQQQQQRSVSDNGTLSNSNITEYSTENRNQKGQVLFSEDLDVDIDSYFITKEDTIEKGFEGLSDLQKQSKKDLKPVDHSQIDYIPIRKNFFIVPKELCSMTETEINELRKEMGNIKVHGHDIPPPVKSWTQCGLNDVILGVIDSLGYTKPFAIQSQALPCIMSGRNVIGIAKTGSGKTLAFVLPMLRHVLDQPPLKFGDGPIGIVMAPTRELAIQIHDELAKFAEPLQLKTACVYGGAGIAEQIALLKNGAHIVVCTPGRLIDLLCANRGKVTNLTRASFVVLDEADRMFDLGFGPQVMRILDNIRPDRQLVMFSATFPRQLEALAKKVMKNSIEIIVGGRSVACENIKQYVEIYNDDSTKFLRLLELLGKYNKPNTSILIFVDSQNSAGDLFKDLALAGYKDCICTLHGGMDQIERDCTISDFKSQKYSIMIGTSICARGLDVPSIRLVVNYNCPDHYEDYVHRVGRTGRAGRKGVAYTFISASEEKFASDLIKALKQSNNPVPDELVKLSENYVTKRNLGLVQEKKKSNMVPGFVGSGFKFDVHEENKKLEEKKQLALSYAVSNNDEAILDQIDLPTEDEIKKQEKSSQKKKAKKEETVVDKATKAAEAVYKDIDKNDAITEEEKAIQRAQLFAAALTVHTSLSEKQKEKQMAQKMLQSVVNVGGLFRTEVEINDWPRPIRMEILKKDALHSVQHFTNTKIHVKGTFVPPESRPKPGERKLYLSIEGTSEESVQQARSQILNMLGEDSSLMDRRHTGRFTV
ncbi:hypothetical protein C9374_013380 [Naegleria lovaniensis]|uniref:Probable eukaryotic initiation factor 4A n=1 Tax=Naegleria lovaniensis TaxID=51637 RepID=A0AA88GVU3_NAELO|nr:uncharacterized protein C9374_013380 [Naegleria lovaniensis]KAG2391895.1 hypothetical protein C9374_013380 [Naegleria lovaniensis]